MISFYSAFCVSKESDHMVGVCWSVICHLNTVAHGDTWRRVKAQFGTRSEALINRRLLSCCRISPQTSSEEHTETMESFTANTGLTSAFTGENVMQPKANGLWRPWAGKEDRTATDMVKSEGFCQIFKFKGGLICGKVFKDNSLPNFSF